MTEGEGSIREQESKKRGGEEGTTTNNGRMGRGVMAGGSRSFVS
jgi:hypothetical protein